MNTYSIIKQCQQIFQQGGVSEREIIAEAGFAAIRKAIRIPFRKFKAQFDQTTKAKRKVDRWT